MPPPPPAPISSLGSSLKKKMMLVQGVGGECRWGGKKVNWSVLGLEAEVECLVCSYLYTVAARRPPRSGATHQIQCRRQ